MKILFYVLLICIYSSSFAQNKECINLTNQITSVKNVDGRVVKKYIEKCDLSKFQNMAEKSIESMQIKIENEVKNKKAQ